MEYKEHFKKIEKKWQQQWERAKVFKVKQDSKKKKCYVLEMFFYPSGKIHMGHVRNYAIGDAFARYKRAQGFNVLYPMGYDAFGLPAENAAIQNKTHPKEWTDKSSIAMKRELERLGFSYDWDRLVDTSKPEYYKWNQWMFLKMHEKVLVERKKAPTNFCPKCDTVLANEQVVDGKCWRCKADVEIRNLEQWFFRITEYAEELLNDLKKLENWPERVKTMQENWIGRSEGTMIHFPFAENPKEFIPVFTTRPDTLYGVTFMIYAPEHAKVMELVKGTKYEKPVKEFVNKVVLEDRFSRTATDKEKVGMFIGKYAINPVTDEKIPIYIANFVLPEYGTGAVMAVPAHDQRDFEFAKKYKIPIKVVITPEAHKLNAEKMVRAYIEPGILVNSDEFNGWNNQEAINGIEKMLEKKKLGKHDVQYKLRDWLISRQRYWGTPIPMLYCDKCGIVPVPEKDLPVTLPLDVKFTGKENPLTTSKNFVNTVCPKCKGPAKRETDTMDTFVDSSWYFYRYCSPAENKKPFDPKEAGYWLPVDQYIGGIEHAIMHLMYARFFTKVLRDLGLTKIHEPFSNLLCQGMVLKDGAKMSKSLGNVVDPGYIIDQYGADTARLFILAAAMPEKELEWSDKGVEGAFKFINRIYMLVTENLDKLGTGKIDLKKLRSSDQYILSKTHSTIKKVTELNDNINFSISISALNELVTALNKYSADPNPVVFREGVSNLIQLASPFIPHVSEELWEKIGEKKLLAAADWPKHNPKYIDEKLELGENLVRQTIADITEIINLVGKKPKKIELFVAPVWKHRVYTEVLDGKGLKAVMTDSKIKKHGKEAAQYFTKLSERKFELRKTVFKQADEIKILNEAKNQIESNFNCALEIIPAEKSENPKAKTADLLKPGIYIE